jgi:hypothetical protein
MWAIVATGIAFLLAFALRAAGMHATLAWLASCLVVPAVLFVVEYVLPGGADASPMWPIALFVGGIYGAAAGGVGAIFASLMWKKGNQTDA